MVRRNYVYSLGLCCLAQHRTAARSNLCGVIVLKFQQPSCQCKDKVRYYESVCLQINKLHYLGSLGSGETRQWLEFRIQDRNEQDRHDCNPGIPLGKVVVLGLRSLGERRSGHTV